MSLFRKNVPDFIASYTARTHPKLAAKKPLDQLRLMVLDTEATGFEIGHDRILSIAVFEVDWQHIHINGGVEWLVYQPNTVVNKATEIHGILPSDTLKGIPEKQMLSELLPSLENAIVIGHQIWFDALMLNDALRRNFGIGFRNPIIDVGPMAMNELQPFRKSGYINQRPPSIEDLCAHLGLPLFDRHTAEGDAYIAAEIFLLMCGHIRQRKGKITRRDLPIKKM
ncbi:MAG: 3'-5' exonuclease [Pontiellaceae bacterium]|nr:3'-5' exonuclease [Pontiellaceae bacterium]MBN2784396.1 3'-5' exonuclease [Pontiellaceae bacterium]